MSLRMLIHPTRNTETTHAPDPARAEHERQVRKARLEIARRQHGWQEIPETRLVQRNRFLVDAETDLLYVLRRGVVFEPGRATIGYIGSDAVLTYYVDRDGGIVFHEQPGGALRTWSEVVPRQARREARGVA